MAVAGFSEDDLDVTAQDNSLVVSGRADRKDEQVQYLHRGIATRAFERRFELADHVKVVGANLANGMLTISLERQIPEERKPRKVEIKRGSVETLVDKAKKLIGGEEAAKAA
jgi:molecular chaperone IbpA